MIHLEKEVAMKKLTMLLATVCLLPLILSITGCETESSSQISIKVTPNNVTLGIGGAQEFVASGWQDYSWSLSDNSAGVLSTTKGDSTIYTAVAALSSNSTQTLTVSVDVTTTGSSTNATTQSVTARAIIKHQ